MKSLIATMRKRWYYALLPVPMSLLIGVAAATADRGSDDPGPKVQYGGTPIELHFDAPGANVTKAVIDGTPCIIVSFGSGSASSSHKTVEHPVLALSCNWGSR